MFTILTALFTLPLLIQQAEKPQTEAGKAFAQLQEELQAAAPQVSNPKEWEEKMPAFFAKVREKLEGFATKYAGSEEGFEARFQLAELDFNFDRNLSAGVKRLETILEDAKGNNPKKDVQARAIHEIGRAHLENGNHTDAKKWFTRTIQEHAGSVFEMSAKEMLRQLEIREKLAIGQSPISFEVKTLDGKTVSPKSFEGKVLLIDFWATWCGPCRAELPALKSMYSEFHEKGFEILGISLDNKEESLKTFLEKQSMSWPQHFDGKGWENEIAKLYGIQSIPATFLLDRQGKIRYRDLRSDEMKKKIAELLAEEKK